MTDSFFAHFVLAWSYLAEEPTATRGTAGPAGFSAQVWAALWKGITLSWGALAFVWHPAESHPGRSTCLWPCWQAVSRPPGRSCAAHKVEPQSIEMGRRRLKGEVPDQPCPIFSKVPGMSRQSVCRTCSWGGCG